MTWLCRGWGCGLRPVGCAMGGAVGCAVDGAVGGAVGFWRICVGLGWLGDENKKYFNKAVKKIEVLMLCVLKSDVLNAIKLVF